MNDFMRMLAEAHSDDNEMPFRNKADPEAVMMDLREAATIYAASLKACPFAIGDVVTPRENFTTKGAGEPHIVVDIVKNDAPLFNSGDAGSNAWGMRIDFRFIGLSKGKRVAHWGESYEFELYADAIKRKANAAAAEAASIQTPSADHDFQEVAA